jgi:hypothetical protein
LLSFTLHLQRIADDLADGSGSETDDIIDEIAKRPRAPTTPLLLTFSPAEPAVKDSQPQQPQHAPRPRMLKWADEDGTGTNVAEDVPTLDMFGGDGATANPSRSGGDERSAAPKAVPFHMRQAAERAAFAAVQEQARAKRARLETVHNIHSRKEMQAVEAAAYAEEQRQNQAKADAEANAALAAEAAGPKKWGLKRSREGEADALSYGGATIPIGNPGPVARR